MLSNQSTQKTQNFSEITPEIRRATHRQDVKELQEAVSQSTYQPILANCAQLVTQGDTTTEGILRIIGRQVE